MYLIMWEKLLGRLARIKKMTQLFLVGGPHKGTVCTYKFYLQLKGMPKEDQTGKEDRLHKLI